MKAVTYLIYIVIYETLVLGGTAYVVFWLGHSGWWFVLAALMSGSAYPPSSWVKLWNDPSRGSHD